MKKKSLLALILITSQLLLSQVVLTPAINLDIGDTYKYDAYEGVTNIEPGPAGANQTWNFGSMEGYGFYEGVGNICVAPSSTPFSDSTVVSGSNICVQNIGEEDSGPYQYYDGNNSFQDLLAMGMIASGNASFSTYTDILTAMQFPFAYGNSFNDTWELMGFHINLGFYFMRDSAIVFTEADAFGTITTPLGTFQNALRVKRTTTYYSWFRFQEGEEWIQSGPFTDIEYAWYAPNIKVPVMFVSDMQDFLDYGVRYLVDYNFLVTTEEQYTTAFDLYPNPAINQITIQSEKLIKQTSTFSITGQQLETKSFESEQHNIDISSYPKGMYIISIEFVDGSQRSRSFIKN